jgi:hypothetical protein
MMLLLLACAANPPGFDPVALCSDPSGFLAGLWHGWILFFSLIGSLIDPTVAIYAPCNTGKAYDIGYLLGVGVFTGGAKAYRQRTP